MRSGEGRLGCLQRGGAEGTVKGEAEEEARRRKGERSETREGRVGAKRKASQMLRFPCGLPRHADR